MTDEKTDKVVKEQVVKEPIPDYLLKFLRDYARERRPNDELSAIRITVEYTDPSICANPESAECDVRILYKHRDWISKHRGSTTTKD